MVYYKKEGQMDLSDRIAIETGISNKDSFKKIGKLLHRHPSTIAHEIKENRTFIAGNYFRRKDCRFVRQHVQHHVCGDESCEKNCEKYVSRACHRFEKPPYVCNNCSKKKLCSKDKYIYSASLFYCDPMASWQKGCIEKNHEFIRYAIPKKKSLNPYNQDDITLLMNHINSIKRPGLGNKSPYELVEEDDEDFHELMRLLKMHLIPPDEVHLMPDLFFEK